MDTFKPNSALILYLVFISFCELSCKKEVNPYLQPIISIEIDSITSTTAILKGHDLHYGVGNLKDYKVGFYWSSSVEEPSIKDNNATGSMFMAYWFKAKIVGLKPGQIYYVKAYVVNSYASAESKATSFVTSKW